MKVGVGIVTFNRPDYAEKCIKSIVKHCSNSVNYIHVYNDGSDPKYRGSYIRAYKPLVPLLDEFYANVTVAPENHGVAYAKNRLIEQLLKDDCEWLFLVEDDMKAVSQEAIDGYIRVAIKSGLKHLSYAHHGPANVGGAVDTNIEDEVAYYGHAIGSWCLYHRDALNDVGLFDEHFVNAWEHVEHSLRLAMAGHTTGPYLWADAQHSILWVAEVPGSIDKSVIRPRGDWQQNIRNGLKYWRDNKPETFNAIFGPKMPLYQYARNVIGETSD